MKHLITLLVFILISTVHAGTCTSISRTNSASLSVLTSTKYNTDLNTVYTAANAFDGGCVTSGTLESDALNTTQFAPLLKGLHQGCKVIYSSATTVQIDKCLASVDGSFVTTTTTTSAAFGCSGCSAEVASTTYYVYIQTGSTGSTLTPLILTTAPNNDGYDNSGNKALARFYNNGSSDIDQYSIDQWNQNGFIPSDTDWIDGGAATITGTTSNPTKGTVAVDKFRWRRIGDSMQVMYDYQQTAAGAGAAGSGDYLIALPTSYLADTAKLSANSTAGDQRGTNLGPLFITNTNSEGGSSTNKGVVKAYDSTKVRMMSNSATNTMFYWGSDHFQLSTSLVTVSASFIIPIQGWSGGR